jgi:hypothetical protein
MDGGQRGQAGRLTTPRGAPAEDAVKWAEVELKKIYES